MKKTISLLLISLTFSLLLSGCAGSEERAWQSGQNALAKEKYSDAAAAFARAGSFQDAERLLHYAEASLALENGDYANAAAGFRELGDFKDSLLMDTYCQAREQEVLAQTAFSAGDAEQAADACLEAYTLFSGLALFRDSDVRGASCRDQLYTKATEWMNSGNYEAAASAFAALGNWQDSSELQKYCRASAMEAQASYLEAADLFSEIPEILDAGTRSEAAREKAYRLAVELKEKGDYEAAINAFASLGSYRDTLQQLDSVTGLLVRDQLRAGSYAEALRKLNSLSDLSVFPALDPNSSGNLTAFLDSFLNVWMNAHAHVMTSFFACNLLQPYLEPGGELDALVREELAADDEKPLNYGYIYLGSEVLALHTLDEGFTAAKVRALSSFTGSDGYAEMKDVLWVLIDSRGGNPAAAAVFHVQEDSP